MDFKNPQTYLDGSVLFMDKPLTWTSFDLVNKGLPFRDAHEIVGSAVAFAIDKHKDLSECSLQELQAFDRRIEADVFDILSLEGSVNARNLVGGTAPEQVRIQIAAGRKLIAD